MIKVLLAAYNGSKYIEQQLMSILSSKCTDEINVVVSLDESSDNTEEIIRNMHSNNIDLIVQNERKGSAKENFSWLIDNVSDNAEYFMLSDQDDVWFDTKVEESIRKIKALEREYGCEIPCLVFTDSSISDENLNIKNPSFVRASALDVDSGLSFERLVVKNAGQGCTFLFNSSLLRYLRNMPKEIIMHDWWIMLVASCFGKIAFLNQSTMIYRQHSSNEVGALDFDWNFIINKLKNTDVRKSIMMTQRQAAAFLERFHEELPEKQYAFLATYSMLHKMGPLKRRIEALRLGLKSAGMIRTVGLYVFM